MFGISGVSPNCHVFPNLTATAAVQRGREKSANEYGVDGSAGSGHSCGLITSLCNEKLQLPAAIIMAGNIMSCIKV